ncbi:hypothetical protein XENOCAPTIV_017459, partial [Xenoophorus captivus]
ACLVMAQLLEDSSFCEEFIQQCPAAVEVLNLVAQECSPGEHIRERLGMVEAQCERVRMLYRDCARPPPPPLQTDRRQVGDGSFELHLGHRGHQHSTSMFSYDGLLIWVNTGDVAGIGWERSEGTPPPPGQAPKGRVYFTYGGQRLSPSLEDVAGGMWPLVHIQKKVNELVQVETYLRSEGVLVRYWYPIEMLERPPAGSRRTAANGLGNAQPIREWLTVAITRALHQGEESLMELTKQICCFLQVSSTV